MRIRITDRLSGSIDGIQLDRFEVGVVYDIGTSLANYLMAIHAAEPVNDERPARIVPLEEAAAPEEHGSEPRETAVLELAADRPRRARSRSRRRTTAPNPSGFPPPPVRSSG